MCIGIYQSAFHDQIDHRYVTLATCALRKSTSSYVAVVVFLCGSALDLDSTESEMTSVTSVHVGKESCKWRKDWLAVPCTAFL